jgi:hypothetical protein
MSRNKVPLLLLVLPLPLLPDSAPAAAVLAGLAWLPAAAEAGLGAASRQASTVQAALGSKGVPKILQQQRQAQRRVSRAVYGSKVSRRRPLSLSSCL